MDAVEALRLVNRIYARINGRRAGFQTLEDYYEGKQPLAFATQEWRAANAARYSGFSDNWCAPVVNSEAERIKHTGLKIKGSDSAAKVLYEQWLRNEMEMQSSQGFLSSLTVSRSYVIVWGDSSDQPLVSWEHGGDVEIEYDPSNPRIRKAALKTWADESNEYATLYLPDQVWKFFRARGELQDEAKSQTVQNKVDGFQRGTWAPRFVANELWPLRNPMGVVPVVEVPNRPLLKGDPISEISGVKNMQDAINLIWAYMFLSADYASMPARVVLHQGPPKMPILDENGQQIGEKPIDIRDLAEKRLLYLSGADTTIDSWDAAKPDAFLAIIERAVGHISSQSRTPPTALVSIVGMSNVNGDGLKAAEIPLVKKTLEFETFATPALREVYRLIALAMGDQALARQTQLATLSWMNPEIRSESQLADALLKKKQIGYPFEYLLELDGVEPFEVERVLKMREEELNDPQVAAAMRGLDGSGNVDGSVPAAGGGSSDDS